MLDRLTIIRHNHYDDVYKIKTNLQGDAALGLRIIDQKQLQILRDYQPKQRAQKSLMQAAVAMILRDGENGTEVLLMQRAYHPKDPWSGQMAFPGGKIDPVDVSSKAAAIREAFEEVGADLTEDDYIGQLDDLYGLKMDKIFTVHIACYIFKPERDLDLVGNEEVADMVWMPLAHLQDRANAHDLVHPTDPSIVTPAVMINEQKSQILWGLSLRMLSNLNAVLGCEMAVLNEEQNQILRDIENREVSPDIAESIEAEMREA